ncbi:hypothetical protein H6785_00350 [Candidatus Nomurabacteria bacterium]|nr:hypothetical protein [Candidatus Nomurabacteria bacterium]
MVLFYQTLVPYFNHAEDIKMAKKKAGGTHTTLIGCAQSVVDELNKLPDGVIKSYSPGRITDPARSGSSRHLTFVHTAVGIEMKICGDGVQIVTVHTDNRRQMIEQIKKSKKLRRFNFNERDRTPR